MKLKAYIILAFLATAPPGTAMPEADLTGLVKNIQPAVATVVAYDANGNVAGIGTGFFISKEGDLITNYHVLFGKFGAEIKTADKETYRIKTIAAQNQATDLLKVKVEIPAERVYWLEVSDQPPSIAQHVVVVGSPMGLEQSVSDGIVSSVREIPGVGTFYQISAPISPGSSGSPVVDMKGKVVGVATFQFLQGQNLNFAIASQSIREMQLNQSGQSLSEWTFSQSNQKAIRTNPDFAPAHYAIGQAYLKQGDKAAALDQYKILKNLDESIAAKFFDEIYR